jgi:transposase-like protein
MGRPFKCPYCGSNETVSKGVRRNKTIGDRRMRRCKSCHRKFTPKNQQPMKPDPWED